MKKILVCLAAVSAIFTASAQQPAKTERTINVTGIAEMEVVPDEIYVQVTLQEYDKKGAGKIGLDQIKSQFLEACKSIGLTEKEISVQSYSGADGNFWIYKKKKKQNPDLKASIVYSIKLSSVKTMDALVNKLDDEATQDFSIAKVSHSQLTAFKKQLNEEAIKAAKNKAIYLAAAIDEQIGNAITISEPIEINNSYVPQTRMFTANTAMSYAAESAPMDVDFKKIKLQFQVSVTFALK